MRKTYWLAGFVTRIIMMLFWHYKVVNHSRLKDAKSVIIASNHISNFDPPFIGAVTPFEIAYLAKSELFKRKIFAGLIRHLNAIPIVRGKTDMNAINKAMKILDSGKSLLLFPEGTRKGKSIKPGVGMFAMKMQKDILPIYIENADKPLHCMFFFKRTKIIIGELIPKEYFIEWESEKENYQKLAEYVYSKIKELPND